MANVNDERPIFDEDNTNRTTDDTVDLGYQDGSDSQESASDDIKQQAEDLLRAAGGLAGSLGKFAVKKGAAIKDKLEDEEFQEKISANIKAVTDKIDDYVSSDSAKDRKIINVRGGFEAPLSSSDSKDANKPSDKPGEQKASIEMDVEVEGNETVEFQTNTIKSEKSGPIASLKKARAEKKAEKERLRREEEERRQKQRNQSIMVGLLMMCLCFAMILIPSLNQDEESDYTEPEAVTEEAVDEDVDEAVDEPAEEEVADDAVVDEPEEVVVDKENPPILYGEDIKVSEKESYDFGYVEVRARVAAHYLDGPWDLIVLSSDGSEDTSGYIRGVGLGSGIPDEYKPLFDECASNHQEEENYVFTLRGNASWKPMREGSSGGNTGFRFDVDQIVKIEYIPYEG